MIKKLKLKMNIRHSRGLSLPEILVAVAVLGLALIPLFTSFTTMFKQRKKTDDRTVVANYARSIIDECRHRDHRDIVQWIKDQGTTVNPGDVIVLPNSFYPESHSKIENADDPDEKVQGTDAAVADLAAEVQLVPKYNDAANNPEIALHAMEVRVVCRWNDRSYTPIEERELTLTGMIFNKRAATLWE